MAGRHLWIAALLAGLWGHSASAQGFDHSRFQRSTLATISAGLAATAAQQDARAKAHKVGDALNDTQEPPWVVSATYTGLKRPLAPDERRFLKDSLTSVSLAWVVPLYETSMLFKAEGKAYWLPVQKPIVPYFAKELKAGETIDLYVVQPGGLRRARGWAWLFLVEDFQKTKAVTVQAATGNP